MPATPVPTTHSRRFKARITLAVGVLLTLVASLGMAAAMETVRPEWRDPEFGLRLAPLRDRQREGRPIVLFLGTSRTQNAIDPAAMEFSDEPDSPHAFNFGQTAAQPLQVLLNLLRVLDAGVRPGAVVVEVLPVWLVYDGPAETQLDHVAARLSDADLRHLEPFCNDPQSLRTKWLAARAAPWHAQRMVFMNYALPEWLVGRKRYDRRWKATTSDGFVPFIPADPSDDFRYHAKLRAQSDFGGAFGGFALRDTSRRALRELVARCRAEGIPVAFAMPPVSATFRSWFHPGVWESGDAALGAFAGELGVPVFAPPELAETDFADGHHLLPRGAAKYSPWLAETYLRPWLTRQGVSP